jgi:acetyl esterase
VRIRIVRPPGARDQVLPGVMHFHGGGWILGDKETHDRLTRELAVETDAAVVFVDYDRSPEAHYPLAIEQAYAATRFVAEHGAARRPPPARLTALRGRRFVVVADSEARPRAASAPEVVVHRRPRLP